MKIIVFDTETTGKYDFTLPLNSQRQPHLVQLAAAAFNEAGECRSKLSLIVRPDEWEIPEAASSIHGISQSYASEFGISFLVALATFRDFCRDATIFVAHNIEFDAGVLRTAYLRAFMRHECPEFTGGRWYCTMKQGASITKIPGAYGDWKWPKLVELHQALFGAGFDGAHDALADVSACARCYFKMTTEVSQ